jgi:hypothetical protein
MVLTRAGRQASKAKLAAALAIVSALFAGAGTASAQQGSPDRHMIRQACEADYRSLCAGVQPGGGRIIACLQQNSDKLSPGCRQALGAAKPPRSGT